MNTVLADVEKLFVLMTPMESSTLCDIEFHVKLRNDEQPYTVKVGTSTTAVQDSKDLKTLLDLVHDQLMDLFNGNVELSQ